jgi:hypothetical protein
VQLGGDLLAQARDELVSTEARREARGLAVAATAEGARPTAASTSR